jgi:hypothetical protein
VTGLLILLAVIAAVVIAGVVDRDPEERERDEPRSVAEHARELSPYFLTDEGGCPL